MRHLFRDIETRSTLDLKKVGSWLYAGDPSTEVLCVAYAVDDEPARIWTPGNPIPEEFITAACDPDWLIVAHNDAFERNIEERLLGPRYGWPQIPIERHRCTMAMALASALPGSLDGAAAALGLPAKDTEGHRLMMQMAKPRKARKGEDAKVVHWHDSSEQHARLQQYCANDMEIERAIYRKLPPLSPAEQRLWVLDAQINARGFFTDGPLLEAASRIADAAGEAVQSELARLTEGALISTDQRDKLQAWLAEHGCEVKDVQKKTLKSALRRKELDPVARRVIELRLGAAHAAATKIDALLAWRDSDGRVRGTLRFHGASTGRWAGFGPQPQNMKRDGEDMDGKRQAVATGDLDTVASFYPQPLEAVGDIARSMICAAPGRRLLIGDFSGIESRVLAWISQQQSKLDMWAKYDATGSKDDDPYILIGRSLGHPEATARAYGKIADLAFGFRGGVGAWQNFALEDDASDEATIKRYRDSWRASHPRTEHFLAHHRSCGDHRGPAA
jgi:DNA polymerase